MRIQFLVVLFLAIASQSTFAQLKKLHGDPHLFERFRTTAAQNPEYVKMKNEIIALIQSASPRNTNAAAVKSLLLKNAALLKSIYTTAGIEAPKERRMSIRKSSQKKTIKSILPGMAAKLKYNNNNALHKVITPPYTTKEIQTGYNQNRMVPDTSLSSMAMGKTGIKFSSDNWGEPFGIGLYADLFKQQVNVPSEPTIVAVEMKLEYSYQYTGWDTYGSVRGLSTFIRFPGLQELHEGNPFPVFDHIGGTFFPDYRVGSVLMPIDSVETQFEDFLVAGNDSLVAQRYVTPGQVFDIEFGLFFPYETQRGNNGCYHYAEMILKKITIRYLKANEN